MFEILLFLILGFVILYLLSTRFRTYINALFGQWLMRKLMKRMQDDMNRNYKTNDTRREEANNQKRKNHNEKLDPSDIVKKKLNNKSQDQYVDFEEIK